MAIEKIKVGSTEHELIASGLTDESAEKVKLNGIAEGAEVNQNAFSNVVVGSTTIAADSKTDTLTIVAGSNVTITPDATNDKITIAATDTKYSHPTSSGNKHIPSGGASGQVLKWSADGTAAWGTDNDTTYSAGTGISFNGTTINNSGVRSVTTGSSNGTISVNTNGTSTNVAVKGLGSAAYTASTAYATSGHTHSDYAKTADLDSVAFDGYVTKGAEAGSTIGEKATVEGDHNIASSNQAHAEGGYTRAGNLTIYSEFNGSYDSYGYEHAEGYSTLAKGNSAHAEGGYTQAISSMAHAEGISTVASGTASHAEGKETTASGYNAHAEGYQTTSSGENTHAEGNGTTASLQAAHAEGYKTTASGYAAHAEGYNTKASSSYQHVQGKNNIEDTSSAYAHIVGNGSSTSARANAHTLDWDGNAWFAGDVYVGSTGGTNKDSGSKKLLKEGDVTLSSLGAAASSHGTHVTWSTTTPKAAGTAAVGSETKVARGDHVHPAQTTVSGNAGSATKLATARTIDGVSFNGSAAIVHYGTCSTDAATAAKTVACTGFTLVTGASIKVRFTVTNTAAVADLTLNVNNTGAKSIKYRNANLGSAGYLAADRTYEFVYDGTYYQLIGDIDTNTLNYGIIYCSTGSATAAKVGSTYKYDLSSNRYIVVVMNYANSAASALTLNINSKGAKPIYINGKASSSSNYTLPAGTYIVYYNGTNYYFRTDGSITGGIVGNATGLSSTLAVSKGGTGYTSITDTTYTTARYRASALVSTATDPTTNGVINWVYE